MGSCSSANMRVRTVQSLAPSEIIGERWMLLIVGDVFLGPHRLDQFQESLGIARNVLTDRLNWLVDEGILKRVRYSDERERYEYRLTPKGHALLLPLTALREWGDKYLSEKPPTLIRRKSDKKPVVAALVPKGTHSVRVEEIDIVAGPGRKTNDYATWRLLERERS